MKAIVCMQYGQPEVLQLKEVEKPIPKDNEILIKVFATAVNSGDCRLRKAEPWAVRLFFGFTKPRRSILGGVFSGEIEAIGKNVSSYKVADQVFGSTGLRFGAYASYKCLPEDGILSFKPKNISHEQAATIPFGGTTALHFLKKANIKPEQKVLIYGASGAVGTAAVQLAKYFGAQVTAVCSTSNIELIKSLGADKVIDYIKEDFTSKGETYDVIFETVNKLSFANSIKSLKKEGIVILGAPGPLGMLQGLWSSIASNRKVISGLISEKAEDIVFLKELIEKGYYKAVVDRSYSLEQMVEAHRYVEQGHKKGNVAIALS
ncbi:MAG: NAD(P)-dependent alcohol dehydrogenase [Bacteroidetes bacterium]|nr:NAD(P)-dependent alcohol dehydrogenase [Bacteroidota bacterium]